MKYLDLIKSQGLMLDRVKEQLKNNRCQNEVIADISNLIKKLEKKSFLSFLMDKLININSYRPLDLPSPMKQIPYIIDLYFSVVDDDASYEMSNDIWTKIVELIKEISMIYFVNIGFDKGKKREIESLQQVSISLRTFIDYFENAHLSFSEQIVERLKNVCGAYDKEVKQLYGFTTEDALKFYYHVLDIVQSKCREFNSKNELYSENPDQWRKLTTDFIERGFNEPSDWIKQPELKFLNEPGSVFIHEKKAIYNIDLQSDIIDNIINFLHYNENARRCEIIYYADKNNYIERPLIQLDSDNYILPVNKYLIETFYNNINHELAVTLGVKYNQFRNRVLENKVESVFSKLFGNDAKIFKSYYTDESESEQDILIIYKGYCFIIEIKDSLFRAPMRDPIKAYNKIKKDFNKSIQYGYKQCRRVENAIYQGKPFGIYDSKTNKILYKLLPNRIINFFSIIVTQYRYGAIQTNLEDLLVKDDTALYPWSVSIDDLETFILTLKKRYNKGAKNKFTLFLEYREMYHEHLSCHDELELCGLFITDFNTFKELAAIDSIIGTTSDMSDIFDAEYESGLGFVEESNRYAKRKYTTESYDKKYSTIII